MNSISTSSLSSYTSSLSSYIVDKRPSFYGGRQDEYLKFAEEAISSSVDLISEEVACKTDPAIIYNKVITLLQNARHEIAKKHQPENASYFGIRRYGDPETYQRNYSNATTGLYGQYHEYNKKYMERLTQVLAKIPHDLKTFEETSRTVHEIVMGKNCSFHVELIDVKELNRRNYSTLPTEEELQKALDISDKTRSEIGKDYALMHRLKLNQKDLYDRIVINSMLVAIEKIFPSPGNKSLFDANNVVRYERKNIFVLGTLRLELEPGQMFCLARHLTWMYQDYEQDPVDRMNDHSVVFVIHQDPFLIKRTQTACSQIFADILEWDTSMSLDVLKDRVALLRFVYGNSMPCSRGDGAIGDWLEIALYRYHGFKGTKHNSERLPCFELLSTINLSEYLREYRETIVVE